MSFAAVKPFIISLMRRCSVQRDVPQQIRACSTLLLHSFDSDRATGGPRRVGRPYGSTNPHLSNSQARNSWVPAQRDIHTLVRAVAVSCSTGSRIW